MKFFNVHNILLIAVVLPVFALLTACHRTELCYDHYPKAALTFEWEQEWERDYGMAHRTNWDAAYHGYSYDALRPLTPEWVNLVSFRNSDAYGEHYLESAGGDVILTEKGDYSFLLYNGDTEYIVLSDIASLPDARASATPRSRASLTSFIERHPDTRSANPPDVLYSAFIEEVPPINIHEVKQMPVKMQPLVYTYLVRYEFEYGVHHIALARGALGGMAESVYLRDGRTSDNPVIILYDCDIKDYGCEAHVRSFGVPGLPDENFGRASDDIPDRPYTLNLEVLLTNGTTLQFDYDVADQIRNQPRGGVITVSGIRIEDEQNKREMGSGDFDVGMTGWGQVDINFPLPDFEDNDTSSDDTD